MQPINSLFKSPNLTINCKPSINSSIITMRLTWILSKGRSRKMKILSTKISILWCIVSNKSSKELRAQEKIWNIMSIQTEKLKLKLIKWSIKWSTSSPDKIFPSTGATEICLPKKSKTFKLCSKPKSKNKETSLKTWSSQRRQHLSLWAPLKLKWPSTTRPMRKF